MAEKKAGVIVIISSPSGAGKTTLVKKISKRNKFSISISHTTRKPRAKEKNGKDYYFVNNEKFKKLIKNKKLLEYAKVFKNYYGSYKKTVIDKLNKGENIIFDIDWQGTKQIKKKKLKYKIITIFILPPSKKELFNRLLKRDQKDKKIALERMRQFKTDVMHWKDYDFTVINDKIEKCYKQIINFINKKNEKSILKINKKFIKNHIQNLIN
ncbi:guanylate kinase [Candidatus Pelagibacter sp.]|nr:guanylate kinase [Candidatus Pelagibacter sp.]